MSNHAWKVSLSALLALLLMGAIGSQRPEDQQTAECAFDEGQHPEIVLWYGESQTVTAAAHAQRWVNVLGNISGSSEITALSFRLNEGAEREAVLGPDGRRLSQAGDFNLEISAEDLRLGSNRLEIEAEHTTGCLVQQEAELILEDRAVSLPLEIKWEDIENLQTQIGIVDGLWVLERGVVRTEPDHIGYDRVLVIGDREWKNYEVLVSVTVHEIDEEAYESAISVTPSLGVDLHWQGHSNSPVVCEAIHCGWEPTGASFRWRGDRGGLFGLTSSGENGLEPIELRAGQSYWFRIRTQSTLGGQFYQAKIWAGTQSQEPEEWSLELFAAEPILDRGSVLLVAHHVDVSLGQLTITALEGEEMSGLGELARLLPSLIVIAAVAWGYWATASGNSVQTNRRKLGFLLVGIYVVLSFWLDAPMTYFIQTQARGRMTAIGELGKDIFISGFLALGLVLIITSSSANRQD